MEPEYNKVPRDWQNLFAITRFCYIKVLFHTFYYYWDKENCLLYRGLPYTKVRYQGSTVTIFSPSDPNFLEQPVKIQQNKLITVKY